MAKKNEEKEWIKWLVIGASIVVLVLIISLSSNSNENYDFEENNLNGISNDENTRTETIIISGIGEATTITNPSFLEVTISGTDNTISFTKQSNPKKIIFSGVRNAIYLCSGIHNPSIQKSGVDNSVEYVSC